ncbi:MAG: hypothetical protein JWO83_868 [Caulobacteraceae bacterium]|nr:hypothetical protein [Caulobacteraceae bacterium]
MAMSLFHVDNAGALNPLRETPYGSDEELQLLIAEHPSLLGGDPDAAGGWFALARRGPLPDGATRSPRWSVEHLFLSQDATPTVVETLRSGDPRAHGDLFGQILYYAANAALWWPRDALKAAFAADHLSPGVAEGEALARVVGPGPSPESFWDQVEAGLAAGRIRMVLVVDEVQAELARMVDFLNAQLRDAEVWVLEVRQLAGPSGRLLQTDIVGRRGDVPATKSVKKAPAARAASRAEATPPASPARTDAASREAWVSSLRARCDEQEAVVLDDLLRWMSEQYGATSVNSAPPATFRLAVKEGGKDRYPFGVTETKAAAIHLGSLSATRAYEGEEARRGLIHEIAATGLPISEVDLKGDLRIPLKDLATPAVRTQVLAVLDGVIETLRLKEAPSAYLS